MTTESRIVRTNDKFALFLDNQHPLDLSVLDIGAKAIEKLMQFKAGERKNDPARITGIHGPYEEATLRKTGRLPQDYYVEGDEEPWGLRVQESRSNILWQVLSGVMDKHIEFGANYLALALDIALDDDAYARELTKLNREWGDYFDHAGVSGDHHHKAMLHVYTGVPCPACSTLTALAVQDDGMHALFRELVALNGDDRKTLLTEKGLTPLLNVMIPEPLVTPARASTAISLTP